MTHDEIVANTKLMLSGGLQEPRDLIALTAWALGSNPSQMDEVRGDRSLVKSAVEETLRWAGPVGTSTRQTTHATELAGLSLEQGALIGAVRLIHVHLGNDAPPGARTISIENLVRTWVTSKLAT